MKILISAYACEPDKGSEPGVGWHWVDEISRYHDVIVVTRKNNRVSIEEELRKRTKNNIDVLYYDVPKWMSFWKKGSKGVQMYYYMWQYGAYKMVKRCVDEKELKAVVAVTFGNLWKPTFMYKLGVPFVWGPVGGGEEVPGTLLEHINTKQRIFELFRRLSKKLPISNPWFYQICKQSDLIITRTYDSLDCIPKKYRNKCKVMIETGVDEVECDEFEKIGRKPSESNTITYVGRLLSLKMVDIGIRAFASIAMEYSDIQFNIIGDGEMRESLQKLVREFGLEDRVNFLGSKSRNEALRILANSRCMIMPSCKEGGAWVLFEAMMCGRPIICMDTAGMKVVVDSTCGIKIPVNTYEKMVDTFGKAIKRMFDYPMAADEYGVNGQRVVREQYLWSKKGEKFEKLLKDVIKG